MNPLHAVIFDLDDTLYPVSSLPPEVLAPVIDAARRANVGPAAISEEHLEHAFLQAAHLPFPLVAADLALPASIVRAWDDASRVLRPPDLLKPYDDVWPVLSGLARRRFLVTSGYRGFQEGKVRALGIGPLFERVYVDAVDGPEGHRGKPSVFRAILEEWALKPSAALVVGDSERSEIAAGRALGMPTVQILRPGVSSAPTADWHIASLHELPRLIAEIEASS